MAGVEHNTRSRKTSHYLGVFREGLPDESPKKRDSKDNNTRSRDKVPRLKEFLPASSLQIDDEFSKDQGVHGGGQSTTGERSDMKRPPLAPNVLTSTTNDAAAVASPTSMHKDADRSGPLREERESSHPYLRSGVDSAEAPTLDLATIKKSTFHSSPVPASPLRRTSDRLQQVVGSQPQASGNEREEPSPRERSEEDEDSGEEHISKAVFVPHKGSQHEVLDDETQGAEASSPKQGDIVSEPEQWLVEQEIPAGARVQVSEQPILSHPYTSEDNTQLRKASYQSEFLTGSDYHDFTASDTDYSVRDDESSFTDDAESTPTGRSVGLHHMEKNHRDHLHHHQQAEKAPVDAIELIPYRHQVGGHTTMWRFSKRAVCKQLNNRENEFYERIEKYHPKLLKFMPKYV
jgi:hypothetical protein